MRFFPLLLITIVIISCSRSTEETSAKAYADTVITGGSIYTLDERNPRAEALAIKDNNIIFVGSNDRVQDYVSENTVLYDVTDSFTLPGFIDSHSHFSMGAAFTFIKELPLILDFSDSTEEVATKIKRYAEEHPKIPIIIGLGSINYRRDVTPMEALDELVPDRPAFIIGMGYHNTWFNSKMAELVGIDADTEDPIAGARYFTRDEDGNPTGLAIDLTEPFFMKALPKMFRPSLKIGPLPNELTLPPRVGITSVFDAATRKQKFIDDVLTWRLRNIARKGRLPFRMVGTVAVNDAEGAKTAVKKLKKVAKNNNTDRFSIRALKIFVDGVGVGGELVVPRDVLTKLVTEVDAAGFDVHFHAESENAVNAAIDAVETAIQTNGQRDRQPTVSHVVVITNDDIKRAKDLGILISSTGNWTSKYVVDYYVGTLGKEFVYEGDGVYRFKSIIDGGVTFTYGSDFPVGGTFWASPLANIQVGMTRVFFVNPDAEPGPKAEQRLSLEESLRAYTINGAKQLNLEDQIGSIEVGKRADIVMLEKDLFDLDVEEIAETKVLLTIADGIITHDQVTPSNNQ